MTNATIFQTDLTVEERVDNGWRWLSENFPGWQERVNPETLNLYSGDSCICGQVFEEQARSVSTDHGFYYAYSTLFSEANSWINGIVNMDTTSYFDEERAGRVSAALGFNRYYTVDERSGGQVPAEGEPKIDDLQAEWIRRLEEYHG